MTVACCRVRGTECGSACMESFEGGRHYLHYLHHSLASGQTTEREQALPMNRARAAATAHRAQPRGVTPHPRPGAAAKSARLRWRRNGREELPHVRGRGGGREEQPHAQGAVAVQVQEGQEEVSHVKVRRDGGDEISLIQGKEQRLHFAGAAVKRYPTSKVRETQVGR